jgi:hypothetical protein
LRGQWVVRVHLKPFQTSNKASLSASLRGTESASDEHTNKKKKGSVRGTEAASDEHTNKKKKDIIFSFFFLSPFL